MPNNNKINARSLNHYIHMLCMFKLITSLIHMICLLFIFHFLPNDFPQREQNWIVFNGGYFSIRCLAKLLKRRTEKSYWKLETTIDVWSLFIFFREKKTKKNAFEMCLFFAVFFLMTGGHFNNTSEALLKIMKIVYFSTYSVIDAKCLTLVRVKTNIRLILTNAIEILWWDDNSIWPIHVSHYLQICNDNNNLSMNFID